jgi:hypothetical protein
MEKMSSRMEKKGVELASDKGERFFFAGEGGLRGCRGELVEVEI